MLDVATIAEARVVLSVAVPEGGSFEIVTTPSTQENPVEPIPLPDGNDRQASTSPLVTGGEIDGLLQSSRSEIMRTGRLYQTLLSICLDSHPVRTGENLWRGE